FGQGLGIVTFGGILFSAVLTFFVVPAAFYTFEKNRQNVSFNSAKAEIEQACADLEEEGIVPEGCEPGSESASAATGTSEASPGLVDEQSASSADTGAAKPRKRASPRKPGARSVERSDEGEEYEI